MIPIQILLRYNLIYIILSYNVFLSVIYSGKTCDLQQSKPACLILWRMAPVIIMGGWASVGETLDTGRDAEIQHKLVTGSRFRGTESIRVSYSYCMHLLLCYTDGLDLMFIFISAVVSFPARLLSEDVVQDTWDWETVGRSYPGH